MANAIQKKDKLRILCLHGYRQNGPVFRSKLGAFRKAVGKHADLTFMTAPLQIASTQQDGEAVSTETISDNGGYGWWFSNSDDSFNAHEVSDICKGFDDSLKAVHDMFTREVSFEIKIHFMLCIYSNISSHGLEYYKGPFDGLLGFSQGAAFVAMLCGLQEQKKLNYHFQFAILIAGFKSRSVAHDYIFDVKISIPSLHVFGETDKVIPKEMSSELLMCFSSPETVVHTGGHFTPATALQKNAYIHFLSSMNS